MHTPPQEQPPSYASALLERNKMVDTATKTIGKEMNSPFGDADAFSIERLRNFLCYVMMVDYSAVVAKEEEDAPLITLCAADADHFNKVFVTLERYVTYMAKAEPGEDVKTALGAYFWEHVHAPSRALGLPSEAVMVCIRRFAVYKSSIGTYKGSSWAVMHTFGMREWAGKLITDRRVIIPRVAPSPAIERALLRENRRNQEAWFERLDGFDYEVGRYPDGGVAWRQAELGSFDLSARGLRFQARQLASARFRGRFPESRRTIAHLYPDTISIPARLLGGSGGQDADSSGGGKRMGKATEPSHHASLWERAKRSLDVVDWKIRTWRKSGSHKRVENRPDEMIDGERMVQGPFMEWPLHRANPNFFQDGYNMGSDYL